MNAESLNLSTSSGATTAYVTRPHEPVNAAVILIQEYWGINDHIRDLAGRYAKEGYVCVAPDLYRGRVAADSKEASALMQALPIEDGLEIIRKAMDAAEETYQIKNFAITGYCMGGRVGWWIANAHPDRVAALACFHTGGLVTDDPDSPHLTVPDAQLYFGFADEDPSATPEQIGTLERALDEAGASYRSEIYEGAKHGYTQSDFPVYDQAAAERHFRELGALLERTLS